MNIHEYQAKEIFKRYGIPTYSGRVAESADEVFDIAKELESPDFSMAVKAQVHAGGRGKGGGIKIVKTADEARDAAKKILDKPLVTPQTGPEGKPVRKILVERTVSISKEYYASIVLDRAVAQPCLIASEAGGMEIEEVAESHPEKILKVHFSPTEGLNTADAKKIASELTQNAEHVAIFTRTFQAMAKLFLELDASLVEINPLAVMQSGEVIAIDAKINFDVHALFRHPDIAAFHDPSQEDPREAEAKKFDLSYVGLTGNIGCVVNGAGLAMATMDIIKYAGGEPANFLDVGGGASKEKVSAAFKILLNDPQVKAILVNIFGGIMRCDVVAEGILAAVKEISQQRENPLKKIPIVVRLEGTNVKQGKDILGKSHLSLITAASFEEAAEKAVQAAT